MGGISALTSVGFARFNRSNLFPFLWAVRTERGSLSLEVAYTAPENYGDWLSRDYFKPDNFIGYAGAIAASPERHLICLVGYEADRALEVIQAVEPSSATLLVGTKPTKDEFVARNKRTVEEVLGTSKFGVEEIDVSNPGVCCDQLSKLVEKVPDGVGIHIAPLSSKLSCLATFRLWVDRTDIRVWNVPPIVYNTDSYSSGASTPSVWIMTEEP